MKKSLSFTIFMLCVFITLSGSLVVARTHMERNSRNTVYTKTISHTTKCIASRRSIIIHKGEVVHTKAPWQLKIYLLDYKCFVPSSSVHELI